VTITAPPVDQAPTAVISASLVGVINQPLTFDGSQSSDAEGAITAYSWDFGDNTTGNGAIVDHFYGQAGPYTVTLTVTDGNGQTDTVTQTIQIEPDAAPILQRGSIE
jgi:PKD repeat protein